MIQDSEVPAADPEQLIKQYMPLIQKIANRYLFALKRTGAIDIDDLCQAGRIAIMDAQQHYNPAEGASFVSYAVYRIKRSIRRTIGINAAGELPEELLSLDEPANAEQPDGESLLDIIPDPSIMDTGERIAEEEEKEEIRQDVHAAIDRLRSEQGKAVINGLFFNGSKVQELATKLECSEKRISAIKQEALRKLGADYKLRKYRPSFHVGITKFLSTHTSIIEEDILWREHQLEQQFGEGAFFDIEKARDALQGIGECLPD